MDRERRTLNPLTLELSESHARLRRFGEIDWDFTAQVSESAFSAVHWHPCRFPSQIPAITIGRFTSPGDLVLDPFMGSATTLVEAQRLGRRSIGIDVNPVACLLARAKTSIQGFDAIKAELQGVKLTLLRDRENISAVTMPSSVQADKWYMPATLNSLMQIWGMILRLDGYAKEIALACFSSILLPSCREDRHWGYVCDNTQPKSDREPDAVELFMSAIDRWIQAYRVRQSCGETPNWPEATVLQGDAASVLSSIKSGEIDCVITSPPYFGVADYIKAQRLTMEWIEVPIEPLRLKEIGARSKRHRRNAALSYNEELKQVFTEIYRVLKKGRFAVVVFGQSPSRADAQTQFDSDLVDLGFKLEMKRPRRIPVGRRQKPSLVQETVLVLRK